MKLEDIVTEATFSIFGSFGGTTSSLTWILYLLALNPDCQQMLFDEIHKNSDEHVSFT